jgi:hypothetical protein
MGSVALQADNRFVPDPDRSWQQSVLRRNRGKSKFTQASAQGSYPIRNGVP